MATTPVEVRSPTGLTLTMDVFPRGNDTAAQSGISLTEETNRKGIYKGNVTAAATGWHTAHVLLSGTVIAVYDVRLNDNTTTHYAVDDPSLDVSEPRVTQNELLENFEFLMVDTDHVTPKTGLAVTAERSIDGAPFAACDNAVSEVGSGIYVIDLSADDMNGKVITLKFSAADADTRYVTIVTQPS